MVRVGIVTSGAYRLGYYLSITLFFPRNIRVKPSKKSMVDVSIGEARHHHQVIKS